MEVSYKPRPLHFRANGPPPQSGSNRTGGWRGPYSRSGRYEKDKNLLPLPGIDPRSSSPLSSHYIDEAIPAPLTTVELQYAVRAWCHGAWNVGSSDTDLLLSTALPFGLIMKVKYVSFFVA
jgi:hypothetical protein